MANSSGIFRLLELGQGSEDQPVQAEQGGHRLDGAIDLLAYQIQSCGLAVLLE